MKFILIADADAVVAIAKELLISGKIELPDFELNETVVKDFALYAASELQPISAFVGGVLAQEVR